MPEVRNFGAPAPAIKQKQGIVFRWYRLKRGRLQLNCVNGRGMGEVRPPLSDGRFSAYISVAQGQLNFCRTYKNEADACRAIEKWWLRVDARLQAERPSGPVPCFAVKDSAGRDHIYETPAVACRVRIASDGSLRDVVDVDGNPVETRKAERS